MCLDPKEAIFKKHKASSQQSKPLYVRDHIDAKPISRMLINSGTTVNLMSYSIFKKLGREDDELLKANLMLNDVGGGGGGQPHGGQRHRLHGAHLREQIAHHHILHRRGAR
jgi:hypothetical protein